MTTTLHLQSAERTLCANQLTPHPSAGGGHPLPWERAGDIVGAITARINPCPSTFA